MEFCFVKRCGSTLVHYGLLAAGCPHPSASQPYLFIENFTESNCPLDSLTPFRGGIERQKKRPPPHAVLLALGRWALEHSPLSLGRVATGTGRVALALGLRERPGVLAALDVVPPAEPEPQRRRFQGDLPLSLGRKIWYTILYLNL